MESNAADVAPLQSTMTFWSLGKSMRILAMSVLLASAPAFSATLLSVPKDACAAMASQSLTTQTWHDTGDGEFWCSTPYRDLGVGTPQANNVAYYAAGNANSVSRVWMVLNVNQKGQGAAAQRELARLAEVLSQKATGRGLPAAAMSAIEAGRPVRTKVGGASLSVVRSDWPTGRGYEIKVTFN